MSDSTSIESLPAPAGGNIKLGVSEQAPVQSAVQSLPASPTIAASSPNSSTMPLAPAQMDANSLDKVMMGIQHAGEQGLTQLPSRDIPMGTAQLMQDQQIQPNYLPNADKKNYIEEQDTYNSMLEKNKNKQQQQDRLDQIYDEFQLPILIMILFFLFQLPFVQKKLVNFFPSLFLKDGHMTMGGYITKTLLFGVSFYLIVKLTSYASEL